MLHRNNFIVSVAFLILLVVAPIMATENETGRFVVGHTLVAAGTEIKAGAYNVKWESLGSKATVTFTPVGKSQGVTIPGKIVNVSEKFDSNNISIAKDPAGRDVNKGTSIQRKKDKDYI
jgi:hypothetical protein